MRLWLLAAALAWPGSAAPARDVSFQTDDGWRIAALYRAPKPGRPAAILVHGAQAGKREWETFAAALARRGWGCLALDLRGHGDSTKGPKGAAGFETLDRERSWPQARRDILAASRFLEARGVALERQGVVGASIGANLAVQAALERDFRWLVLLSPGLEYRGVGLRPLPGRAVLAAASPGDGYAHQSALALAGQPRGASLLIAKSGHGAQMLEDPEFLGKVLDWASRHAP